VNFGIQPDLPVLHDAFKCLCAHIPHCNGLPIRYLLGVEDWGLRV
jgi:hypothetical protein